MDMTKQQIIEMLDIPEESSEWDGIIKRSFDYCRRTFGNKAYIFAQVGLNSAPCSGKCGFCSLAEGSNIFCDSNEKSAPEVLKLIPQMTNVSDLFLMTTADYSFNKFLSMGKAVKSALDKSKKLVANVGDFDLSGANRLKEAGFTGVYHIKRLREGIDTALSPELREKTINAVLNAELDLYYCIEPIGPEHTSQELADMIEYAKGLNVDMMAVMRRVGVLGTPLYTRGEITEKRLTQIAAVTALAVKPKKSMNAHEPSEVTLKAGVNQLYAEFGLNPRDVKKETSASRALSISKAKEMLERNGLKL